MSTMTLAFRTPSALTLGRRGRDHELLSLIGRQGIVAMPHVMAALGVGQTAAYDRVAALIEAGLLERIDLVRGEPSLLRSTRAGLRYAGLGLAPAVISPGAIDHWLRCATAAQLLADRFGADRILTERELALAERHARRPLASAKLGELPDGRPRLHRPDLVVLPEGHPLIGDRSLHVQNRASSLAAHPRTRKRGRDESGVDERDLARAEEMRAYAKDARASGGAEDVRADVEEMRVCVYEVELTPKSPKRLREIVRGWRRAGWVAEVIYLCEPGQTRTAVERAVEKLHASGRIKVETAPPRVREQGAR